MSNETEIVVRHNGADRLAVILDIDPDRSEVRVRFTSGRLAGTEATVSRFAIREDARELQPVG